MKYQSQHDLIDPEVPSPETGFEFEGDDDSDAPHDSFVIGEDGTTFKAPPSAGMAIPSGPKPWVKPAAFVLGALFVATTLWNLSLLLQSPPQPPKPSPFQVKQALYLGVMKIDAYRRVHGVVPDTLADAGLPGGGPYAYRRIDPSHYLVSFEGDGHKLEYDSNEPKERFFGSPREVLTMGDSK